MPRNITVKLIVHPAEDCSNISLMHAVAEVLTAKGFKVALPHVYPEDQLIIECMDTIPAPHY